MVVVKLTKSGVSGRTILRSVEMSDVEREFWIIHSLFNSLAILWPRSDIDRYDNEILNSALLFSTNDRWRLPTKRNVKGSQYNIHPSYFYMTTHRM